MTIRKKILLLISTSLLSWVGLESSAFSTQSSTKLKSLNVQTIPLKPHRESSQGFINYLNSLKDGKNGKHDELITQVINNFNNSKAILNLRIKKAIEELNDAGNKLETLSQQSVISSQQAAIESKKHQEALAKIAQEKEAIAKKAEETSQALSKSVQKVQETEKQVQEAKQEVHETKKQVQEAKQEVHETKKELQEVKSKFENVAEAFGKASGALIAEISAIRYLAYQDPILYQKTLEGIISASQAINNLIIDYNKDLEQKKLRHYLRITFETQQDFENKEKNLIYNFKTIQGYLIHMINLVNKELDDLRNNSEDINVVNKDKIAHFKEVCDSIEKVMDLARDTKSIFKFLNNKEILDDFALSIESLLGNKKEVVGTLYPTIIKIVNKQAHPVPAVYNLCYHLYDLHNFLVANKILNNFEAHPDYFNREIDNPKHTPEKKPLTIDNKIIKNISSLDSELKDYSSAQSSLQLAKMFPKTNEIKINVLQEKVSDIENAQEKIDKFIESLAKKHIRNISFKEAASTTEKSFIPQIYQKMMLGKSSEIADKLTKIFKKLKENETEFSKFIKGFQDIKGKSHSGLESEKDIEDLLKTDHASIEKSFSNIGLLLKDLKLLSEQLDQISTDDIYIKYLFSKIKNALDKHIAFQEAIKKLEEVPITDHLLNDEQNEPEQFKNIHKIKNNLKDVILKKNYLDIEPKERAESFSYTLGSLGLDVAGVWKSAILDKKETHQLFLNAYKAYIEARDSIISITDHAIDDSKNFMSIDLSLPSQGGQQNPPQMKQQLGQQGQGQPGGGGTRGIGGAARGGGGAARGGPGRGSQGINSNINILQKEVTSIELGSKTYQKAQQEAIDQLITSINDIIGTAIKNNRIAETGEKNIKKGMYLFLWNAFYKKVEDAFFYLDLPLVTCAEGIEFIKNLSEDQSFHKLLDGLIRDNTLSEQDWEKGQKRSKQKSSSSSEEEVKEKQKINPKPKLNKALPAQSKIDLLIEQNRENEAIQLIKESFKKDANKDKLLPTAVNQFTDKQLLAFPIEILVQVTPDDIAHYTENQLDSFKNMRFQVGGKGYLNQLTPQDLKNLNGQQMSHFLTTGERPSKF